MADYRFVERPGGGPVIFQGDVSRVIPEDVGNRDWQIYLAWVAGGGITDAFLSGSISPGDAAAIAAKAAVQSATDIAGIKSALNTYFGVIDQV